METPPVSDFPQSGQVPAAGGGAARTHRGVFGLSLFWRIFFLFGVLLVESTFVWVLVSRQLESVSSPLETANQIVSIVNRTRTALAHSQVSTRSLLIAMLAQQESLRIVPRRYGDRRELYGGDAQGAQLVQRLTAGLGLDTQVASSVNGIPGLWVSFALEGEKYWMQLDPMRLRRIQEYPWIEWLLAAVVLSVIGGALVSRQMRLPLRELGQALRDVYNGQYKRRALNEQARANELRDLNINFNRMVDQMARVEKNRATMLAGISHDLRTPLARLRLEAEMSVTDEEALTNMEADIEQIDAIIGKFLDYARSDRSTLEPVLLRGVIDSCTRVVSNSTGVNIAIDVPDDLGVVANRVELTRVITNLIENACRYGKTPKTEVVDLTIRAMPREGTVVIEISDRGMGVSPTQLNLLTEPFYRGDKTRIAAAGTGLGLSIVEKCIKHMGGGFSLSSAPGRGLTAHIRLPHAANMEAGA
ncbi:MAG: two-component sensor histidine kinase [Burkholderiaceae bacterium]|jgi:two-component system osmolarity sensor histidine kinase EnvZ|nr:two-component sensor histidine kinase [Burkholderiaceae bacterium]